MCPFGVCAILVLGAHAEFSGCVAGSSGLRQCQEEVPGDSASLLQVTKRGKVEYPTTGMTETASELKSEKVTGSQEEHKEDEELEEDEDEDEDEELQQRWSQNMPGPWTATLRTKHNSKCVTGDRPNGGWTGSRRRVNVHVEDCIDPDCSAKRQQWYFKDDPSHKNIGQMSTLWAPGEAACMDYDTGNNNVYMHSCHGGGNQKWRLTSEGFLKTDHDDKCLDYNFNSGQVYMHTCHGGENQKWYFDDSIKLNRRRCRRRR